MKQKLSLRYILVLIACCGMSGAALGMLTNVSGVFFTPIADDLGIGRGLVSLTLTISNLAMAAGGMFTARLVGRLRLKTVLIAAALLFSGATAGLGLAPNIVILYLLNAVRGFAAGFIGNVLVTLMINSWFLRNSGTFTSIAMAVSGIMGAVFSPVLSGIIARFGWRAGYFTAASVILVLELPAILFPIDVKPQGVGFRAYGEADRSGQNQMQDETTVGPSGRTYMVLFLLATVYAVVASFATSYPQHFPGISESFSLSAETGVVMVSVCLVANTAGKLLFGILADHFGTKRTILLYGLLLLSGNILMLFLHQKIGMFPAAAFFGLSYALATVGIVMLVRTVFGLEQYSRVYPKISLFTTASNALGSSLVGFIYDGTGSYMTALYLLSGMIVLQLVSVLLIFRMQSAGKTSE